MLTITKLSYVQLLLLLPKLRSFIFHKDKYYLDVRVAAL